MQRGEGRERRVVVVKEEGKEVEGERELLSPRGRSSPSTRSFEREREREVGKRRKNLEERRTDQLFFLFDCPCTLLPPREARNDRLEKKRRPKSRREEKTKMFKKRRPKFSFHSVQDRICEWTGLNRDRDRQRLILMDRRSRSGSVDRTSVGLCGTLLKSR